MERWWQLASGIVPARDGSSSSDQDRARCRVWGRSAADCAKQHSAVHCSGQHVVEALQRMRLVELWRS